MHDLIHKYYYILKGVSKKSHMCIVGVVKTFLLYIRQFLFSETILHDQGVLPIIVN